LALRQFCIGELISDKAAH